MTSKALQKNISFSLKFQMLQAKMNLYLNLPIYSNVAGKSKFVSQFTCTALFVSKI